MLEKIESQATTLKQFTTDMSHEFKTPLMVMSTHIDLIEKKYT
jgi:signal transduction histidine kinase